VVAGAAADGLAAVVRAGERDRAEQGRRAIGVAAHRAEVGVNKGPHIARRTITKRALRTGEDPIRVQLMMGWASPAMVLRYADEVAQETAAARLVEHALV
jgi:integrase